MVMFWALSGVFARVENAGIAITGLDTGTTDSDPITLPMEFR